MMRFFCTLIILRKISYFPHPATCPFLRTRLVFAYPDAKSSQGSIFISSMAHAKLENYLKSYKKRSGLTQREVAFLLGCDNGAQVSRYEKRRRVPPLGTALACEAVFGVPVAMLFAGLSDRVGKTIQKRLLELRSRLLAKTCKGSESRMVAQKLHWFADRHGMTDGSQISHP